MPVPPQTPRLTTPGPQTPTKHAHSGPVDASTPPPGPNRFDSPPVSLIAARHELTDDDDRAASPETLSSQAPGIGELAFALVEGVSEAGTAETTHPETSDSPIDGECFVATGSRPDSAPRPPARRSLASDLGGQNPDSAPAAHLVSQAVVPPARPIQRERELTFWEFLSAKLNNLKLQDDAEASIAHKQPALALLTRIKSASRPSKKDRQRLADYLFALGITLEGFYAQSDDVVKKRLATLVKNSNKGIDRIIERQEKRYKKKGSLYEKLSARNGNDWSRNTSVFKFVSALDQTKSLEGNFGLRAQFSAILQSRDILPSGALKLLRKEIALLEKQAAVFYKKQLRAEKTCEALLMRALRAGNDIARFQSLITKAVEVPRPIVEPDAGVAPFGNIRNITFSQRGLTNTAAIKDPILSHFPVPETSRQENLSTDNFFRFFGPAVDGKKSLVWRFYGKLEKLIKSRKTKEKFTSSELALCSAFLGVDIDDTFPAADLGEKILNLRVVFASKFSKTEQLQAENALKAFQ